MWYQLIPKMFDSIFRGVIMIASNGHEKKRIETKTEVSHYISILKYAIHSGYAKITLQRNRFVDTEKDERFTNHFTIDNLFPDEDSVDALKRELHKIEIENYIETVEDTRYPTRSEMRVFGKKYGNDDVYIKIRAELMKSSVEGVNDVVYIMSFHYAEWPFTNHDFPYL